MEHSICAVAAGVKGSQGRLLYPMGRGSTYTQHTQPFGSFILWQHSSSAHVSEGVQEEQGVSQQALCQRELMPGDLLCGWQDCGVTSALLSCSKVGGPGQGNPHWRKTAGTRPERSSLQPSPVPHTHLIHKYWVEAPSLHEWPKERQGAAKFRGQGQNKWQESGGQGHRVKARDYEHCQH